MPRVQWAGRCSSTTARSTAGGAQGYLDLERDPLMHIMEETYQGKPQTTMEPAHHHRIWETSLFSEQARKVFVSCGNILSHAT